MARRTRLARTKNIPIPLGLGGSSCFQFPMFTIGASSGPSFRRNSVKIPVGQTGPKLKRQNYREPGDLQPKGFWGRFRRDVLISTLRKKCWNFDTRVGGRSLFSLEPFGRTIEKLCRNPIAKRTEISRAPRIGPLGPHRRHQENYNMKGSFQAPLGLSGAPWGSPPRKNSKPKSPQFRPAIFSG